MNRTRLLMIGVLALALGFFASVYVYKNLQAKNGAGGDSFTEVIVAAEDLQVGARVEEHDIKVIKIPAADLPPGAPRKRSDVVGPRCDRSYFERRIYPAQPLGRRECRIRTAFADPSRHAGGFCQSQ